MPRPRTAILTLAFLCIALMASADNLADFHDDFDGGLDPAWQVGDPSCSDPEAEWFLKDGQLCAEVEGYAKCGVVLVGEEDWKNYEISYEVTLERGADRIAVVHWQDLEHCLQINLTNWLDAVVMVAGKSQIIFHTPQELVWGETYEVRFQVRNSTARVWVDGVKVGQMSVKPWIEAGIIPESGRTGLLTWSGGGVHQYEYLCFDNFSVRQLHPEIEVSTEKSSWGAMKANYR